MIINAFFECVLKVIITVIPRPRPVPPLFCYMYRLHRTNATAAASCSKYGKHRPRLTPFTTCESLGWFVIVGFAPFRVEAG